MRRRPSKVVPDSAKFRAMSTGVGRKLAKAAVGGGGGGATSLPDLGQTRSASGNHSRTLSSQHNMDSQRPRFPKRVGLPKDWTVNSPKFLVWCREFCCAGQHFNRDPAAQILAGEYFSPTRPKRQSWAYSPVVSRNWPNSLQNWSPSPKCGQIRSNISRIWSNSPQRLVDFVRTWPSSPMTWPISSKVGRSC